MKNKKIILLAVGIIVIGLGVLIGLLLYSNQPSDHYVEDIEANGVADKLTKINVLKAGLDALAEEEMDAYIQASEASLSEMESINGQLQAVLDDIEVPASAETGHSYLVGFVATNVDLTAEMRLMLGYYADLTAADLTPEEGAAIYEQSMAQMQIIAGLAAEASELESNWLNSYESMK